MRRPGPTPSFQSRRVYTEVQVAAVEGGFEVQLDRRSARTPAGARLVLPTKALAELVAGDWAAQGETLDLAAMPANRLAATVIDRTAVAGAALARAVSDYAAADVLCYLAEAPQTLVEAEAAAWKPLLAWAQAALGVELRQVQGVSPRPQLREALDRVETLVAELDPFSQAGVAVAAALFGSAILALALQRGRLDAQAAFALSRLDEAYQEQRWGIDVEAAERTAQLDAEAALLGRWFEALER